MKWPLVLIWLLVMVPTSQAAAEDIFLHDCDSGASQLDWDSNSTNKRTQAQDNATATGKTPSRFLAHVRLDSSIHNVGDVHTWSMQVKFIDDNSDWTPDTISAYANFSYEVAGAGNGDVGLDIDLDNGTISTFKGASIVTDVSLNQFERLQNLPYSYYVIHWVVSTTGTNNPTLVIDTCSGGAGVENLYFRGEDGNRSVFRQWGSDGTGNVNRILAFSLPGPTPPPEAPVALLDENGPLFGGNGTALADSMGVQVSGMKALMGFLFIVLFATIGSKLAGAMGGCGGSLVGLSIGFFAGWWELWMVAFMLVLVIGCFVGAFTFQRR